ncbi:hypothetical protein R1sor_022069 [Riccia sorocarpa]|uniref:Uncharacterized protein n=1 Tax=Riccia sorocarpa TaxID=122646 RepID=A0ABD3GIU2_9MARC
MQSIIRGQVERLSSRAFGTPGVQWLYTANRIKPEGLSTVLSYSTVQCVLGMGKLEEMDPAREDVHGAVVEDDSALGDGPGSKRQENPKRILVAEQDTVWEWLITAKTRYQNQLPPADLIKARKFRLEGVSLQLGGNEEKPSMEQEHKPIKVTEFIGGQGRSLRILTQAVPEGMEEQAQLQWANGSKFFSATIGQIRRLLSHDPAAVKTRLKKWSFQRTDGGSRPYKMTTHNAGVTDVKRKTSRTPSIPFGAAPKQLKHGAL